MQWKNTNTPRAPHQISNRVYHGRLSAPTHFVRADYESLYSRPPVTQRRCILQRHGESNLFGVADIMDHEEKEGLLGTETHQYESVDNRHTSHRRCLRENLLKTYLIISHFVFVLIIIYLILQNRAQNGQDAPDLYCKYGETWKCYLIKLNDDHSSGSKRCPSCHQE